MTHAAASTQPRLEDLAYLSNQHSGALVARNGDLVWLCLPRFDAPAVFTSLLGAPEHGQWSLRVVDGEPVERAYVPGTLVVRTRWRGPHGEADMFDLMPLVDAHLREDGVPEDPDVDLDDLQDLDGAARGADGSGRGGGAPSGDDGGTLLPSEDRRADVLRLVRCVSGTVEVEQRLWLRAGYGEVVPWVSQQPDAAGGTALVSVAGGDGVVVHCAGLEPDGRSHVGRTALAAGEALAASLAWFPAWTTPPAAPEDPWRQLRRTVAGWRTWLGDTRRAADSPRSAQVARSLLTLRGLTHRDTGGIVAAATSSLPEDLGGERNWDYRYVWLRDTALTLEAMIAHDHADAAASWRDWLLRAIAGEPEDVQIMYTLSGERRMAERELDHLPGYGGSTPVRVGNGASSQWQADVIGEVMLALSALRDAGEEEDRWSWGMQRRLVEQVLRHRDTPGHGVWEMRGEPAFFTHGRVMMWAALDRAVAGVEDHGLPVHDDELDAWRRARDALREEILDRGVDADGAFTQTYGSDETDASLLQIPHTGFVAFDDPHMLATVRRIEEDLVSPTGLVRRYRATGQDGLDGDEAPFMMCSHWLVEQYARSGRVEDAERLMARLDECATDVGLLAEEYDDDAGRMLGNLPQAFSHLGLIRAADALDEAVRARDAARGPGEEPAEDR